MPRPSHLIVTDELGLTKSMPAAREQFEWSRPGDGRVVFLGLGPFPELLPEWFGIGSREILFLECPDFTDQVENWRERIPDNFRSIAPEEFTRDLAHTARVVRYLPTQRAFPSFFAPLTARFVLDSANPPQKGKTVWLPVAGDDLLCRELAQAFEETGYAVTMLDHLALGRHPGQVLPKLLDKGVPDLFFSINFKGLDPYGLGHAILREAGVHVGVWLVDNPFNLLTAVKSEYWRTTKLFVTDHTFIGPLIGEGARWASHLPLAASPPLFETGGVLPEHAEGLEDRLVFVGRSEFPDKKKFFAGLAIPAKQAELVRKGEDGERFDYHWWHDQLGITPLWPGNRVREIGAGTEWAGRKWKRHCLEAAGPVMIFGDNGWQGLANPDTNVRGPVDYYTHLPAVYRSAAAVLNVTGMQLPAGLTQRHFDVWCAGGFLLTDAHPGLDIFPKELVEPIRFTQAADIHDLFVRFRRETDVKQELRAAWRDCILSGHTYAHRVGTILTVLDL